MFYDEWFRETNERLYTQENAIEHQEESPVYYITDTRRNVKVSVCFAPLTADDRTLLVGEDWQGARFQDVWIESAEHGVGLKLTLCAEKDGPILGLVRLGTAPQLNGDKGPLRSSLLEAAPVHQYGTTQRAYKGIGRVLVERLVEESKAQGADGSVLVRPSQDSIPFYRGLGFQDSRIKYHMLLKTMEAEALLKACLSPSP